MPFPYFVCSFNGAGPLNWWRPLQPQSQSLRICGTRHYVWKNSIFCTWFVFLITRPSDIIRSLLIQSSVKPTKNYQYFISLIFYCLKKVYVREGIFNDLTFWLPSSFKSQHVKMSRSIRDSLEIMCGSFYIIKLINGLEDYRIKSLIKDNIKALFFTLVLK